VGAENLVASVGVAPHKFLAKIASDLRKPDAYVVIEPGQEQSFLDPLSVGRIWGVGKVTGARFSCFNSDSFSAIALTATITLFDRSSSLKIRRESSL
jgi:nucleotidyltransferase/DNA polymerase involved in DNA repair